MSLSLQLKRHFTILPYRLMKRAEYTFEPIMDLYARKFRKMALDHSILEKNRLLIPAKRTRLPEDTLLNMRKNHEIAGVILPREEHSGVDFVMDQRQGYTLRRIPHMMVQSYHVRIPETNEMIRVTINEMEHRPDQNWIPWVHFNRYIVGRPNLLYIPIKIRKGFSNPTLNTGGTIFQKIHGIYVYSYNDDYPTTFEIDPHNVTCSRGYRLGDLMNSFPDGVLMHPKYEHQLTSNIFRIKANTIKKMIQEVKFYSKDKKEETKDSIEEEHLVGGGEAGKDKTQEEQKQMESSVRKSKTMFDYIVDKREVIKDEQIKDAEIVPEEKTYAELQREEKKQKKAELKKKLGGKTPFGNVKKAILEEYSLKETFKESQEKDKKGGKEPPTPK